MKGIPITPKMGRVLFSELAEAVLADYKMMDRLYSTSKSPANSQHLARDGQSLGKVEPVLASSYAQTDRNLLESHDGPVAQKDRAAVS